jgi:serralysin
MTNYNQTTNSVGTGTRFTLAAAGDSYHVFEDVLVESTSIATAIYGELQNQSVFVDGRVVSDAFRAIDLAGPSARLEIGAGATVVSGEVSYGDGAVFLQGGGGEIINRGQVQAEQTIALLINGGNNLVENSGSIVGGTGVFLGLFGYSGDRLVNSGKITATTANEGSGARYTHGVVIEGTISVVNEKSGVITASTTQGAAVAIGFDSATFGGDGSTVTNLGLLKSSQWYGVDFQNMVDSQQAFLTNSGTIQGKAGSFRGNESGEEIINSGKMIGDVWLNSGDDIFDSTKGSVKGDISGGNGNDWIYAGSGTQAVSGGIGNDIIIGGKNTDELTGNAGIDTFVFRTGFGKDTITDLAVEDFINLRKWKAIDDFSDLKAHAQDHGRDTWIVSGSDTLIIKGMNEDDLQEASFIL